MTTRKIPTLDQYWEGLAAGLPAFSPEEQRAAMTLYRELAKGQPVDAEQLAQALGARIKSSLKGQECGPMVAVKWHRCLQRAVGRQTAAH